MAIDLLGRLSSPSPEDYILYLSSLNNKGYLHMCFMDSFEADLAMSRLQGHLASVIQDDEDVLNQGPYLHIADVVCSVLLCQGRNVINVAPAA
jgi:hypothetical protein